MMRSCESRRFPEPKLRSSNRIKNLEAPMFSMTKCARRYVRLQYIANFLLTWRTAAKYFSRPELGSPTIQTANARQATADRTNLMMSCGLKNHVTAKARGRVGKMTEEGHSRPCPCIARRAYGRNLASVCIRADNVCAMTRFFRHSGTTVTRAGRDWCQRIGRKRFACRTHTPVAGHV
jgi:hypothetical protein